MIGIKICGLCRAEDAAEARGAGADYVGVILAPNTARSQSIGAARGILDAAAGVKRVGVFVNPDLPTLQEAVRALGLDVVQLHGDEPAAIAQAASRFAQVWKAVRVRSPEDIASAAVDYSGSVQALLLDAYHPARAGGSGIALDWLGLVAQRQLIPASLPIVLAGGLTADNVAAAVRTLQPDVVDVSSGVEHAVGEKSAERIRAFVSAARATAAAGLVK
jgi:phosphoribosylanthranilate isomerase